MGNSPVDRNEAYMKEVLNDEAKPIEGAKKQVLSEESSYDSIPNRY